MQCRDHGDVDPLTLQIDGDDRLEDLVPGFGARWTGPVHPVGPMVVPGVTTIDGDRLPFGFSGRVGDGGYEIARAVPLLVQIGRRRSSISLDDARRGEPKVRLGLVADHDHLDRRQLNEFEKAVTADHPDRDQTGGWFDGDHLAQVLGGTGRICRSRASRGQQHNDDHHRRPQSPVGHPLSTITRISPLGCTVHVPMNSPGEVNS